jgi:hypothetical protein
MSYLKRNRLTPHPSQFMSSEDGFPITDAGHADVSDEQIVEGWKGIETPVSLRRVLCERLESVLAPYLNAYLAKGGIFCKYRQSVYQHVAQRP